MTPTQFGVEDYGKGMARPDHFCLNDGGRVQTLLISFSERGGGGGIPSGERRIRVAREMWLLL